MNTVSWMVLAAFALSACEGGFPPREATRAGSALELTAPAPGARVIDRDVPAPQVFDLTESGLWDGRPSLGGVWVAHPTARDPERVIIRNTQSGTEVIGALFRRERENPGPRYQISSEAAAALGILAGQPATISVIALRVERVGPSAPPPSAAADTPVAMAAPGPDAVEGDTTTLQPVPAAAAPQAEPSPPRGLRGLFARPAAPAETGPTGDAQTTPVAPATATPMPETGPVDRVEITSLDPSPAAPRRGLRDLFRRDPAAAPTDAGITQTALAPAAPVAAPLAATPLLADPGTSPLMPAALGPMAEPGQSAAARVERRGLRDLFRRQPAQPAADTTLIPLPDQAPVQAALQAPTVAAAPGSAISPSQPDRPFVQIGIFSVEANANRARTQMRAAGLPAEVRQGSAGNNRFWRVVIGPAPDGTVHADHLRRARAAGFTDAYAVVR